MASRNARKNDSLLAVCRLATYMTQAPEGVQGSRQLLSGKVVLQVRLVRTLSLRSTKSATPTLSAEDLSTRSCTQAISRALQSPDYSASPSSGNSAPCSLPLAPQFGPSLTQPSPSPLPTNH